METLTPSSEQERLTNHKMDAIELALWREFRKRMEGNEIMSRILRDEFMELDARAYNKVKEEL